LAEIIWCFGLGIRSSSKETIMKTIYFGEVNVSVNRWNSVIAS
jgi:hypothetical protein